MKNILILENIRSAYNVGTMIRTADALWWDVICSGFTPTPDREEKVKKSSLWAEEHLSVMHVWNTREALEYVVKNGYYLIASELTQHALPLQEFQKSSLSWPVAVIMGSETDGVLPESLDFCKQILYIPMRGFKESLNVAEAAAIMMWELV